MKPVLISLCLFCVAPALCFHADAGISLEPVPLDIVGVNVTVHQYSEEFQYSRPPNPELGALVRLFVAHRDPQGSPAQPALRFNGKTAPEWLAAGDWTWYETPDNLGTDGAPYELAPGGLAVFTFNAASADWGVGAAFTLDVEDRVSGKHASVSVPIVVDPVRLRSVVCLARETGGIIPERLILHVSNDSSTTATLREVAVYHDMRGDSRKVASVLSRPETGIVLPGDFMVAMAETGPLPLQHGLVELLLEDELGETKSLWARVRFKADRFDIGSGWLSSPTREDIIPLRKESYLKTLKRMHVNLFWGEHVPGYTDDTGPEGLYARFPLRQMAYFEDIDRYNDDAWVARIHGVDRLGEPQHGGQPPMDVYEVLKKYDAARYPTTLTLSDEKDWRYYAGIVDFPHYDSYRVSAPAMDNWRLYDCWDRRIFWGAPLEGIGVMTRSLRELSEPLPIALWSQNAHPGWQDQFTRKRCSPTSDEILLQAYQGLANGVISLYWYSLETWSLLKFRDTINTTTRIGREIRLLEDLYLAGYATWFRRVPGEQRPSLEFNVISAPDAALMVAMDLDYYPDHEERVFAFRGPRSIEAEFALPGWLRRPVDVFRVDADGVYDVNWEPTDKGVIIRDALDRVGLYIAAQQETERTAREAKLRTLKEYEQAIGFDPATSDADFQRLMNDLGYDKAAELEAFR